MTSAAPPTAPATLPRRHWLLTLAGMGAGLPLWAAGRTLPTSTSLPHELAGALQRGQPLVVMVSLHGCPFCEVVRNNYLAPMREREGLAVVQIDMLEARATRDMQGKTTTHEALVRAWNITVAPTVLFFGAQGKEVAPRLAGGDNDFYSAYLDNRIEQARKTIQS